MGNLQQHPAKVCLTSSGALIHAGRVLLVKHKKLGLWLCPGGHLEENELPHHAAEREFWEETGVRVRATALKHLPESANEEFLPEPLLVGLHWVSRQNFDARQQSPSSYAKQKGWEKGCEQHCNFFFLVEPVAGVQFTQNVEETEGIGWFRRSELADIQTTDSVKAELEMAFKFNREQSTVS